MCLLPALVRSNTNSFQVPASLAWIPAAWLDAQEPNRSKISRPARDREYNLSPLLNTIPTVYFDSFCSGWRPKITFLHLHKSAYDRCALLAMQASPTDATTASCMRLVSSQRSNRCEESLASRRPILDTEQLSVMRTQIKSISRTSPITCEPSAWPREGSGEQEGRRMIKQEWYRLNSERGLEDMKAG